MVTGYHVAAFHLTRMLTVKVLIHRGRSAVRERPLFIREPLITDAERTLRLLHEKGERVGWRGRLPLATHGSHELGSADAEVEKLIAAQPF